MEQTRSPDPYQTGVGAAICIVAAVMAFGASGIPSAAGYAGVGPNFLPWVVSLALAVCGVWLLVEARTGGFRQMEEPSGAAQGDWPAFAWVSAGILVNAAAINHLGFIFSCTACFMLAVRGLRVSEGKAAGGARQIVLDFATGFAIAAPAYWMFTKVLSINLPGLTETGWL